LASAAFTVTSNTLTSLTTPTPVSANCGAVTTLSSFLKRTDTNAALSGQSVSFTAGSWTCTATTAATGEASCTITPTSPIVSTNVATYSGQANVFGPATASTPFSVVQVGSALSAPALTPNPSTIFVGGSFTAATVLSRTDTAPVAAGLLVIFTTTLPGGGGATIQNTVSTVAGGAASTPVSGLVARGLYTVQAAFAASTCVTGSTSSVSSYNVYQKATLAVTASNGVCGASNSVTVTATALTSPDNSGIAGVVVTFTFTGAGAPSPVQATTNTAGVATATVTPSSAGSFTVSASFPNDGFLTTVAGTLPVPATISTTSSPTVTIAAATTSLSTPSVSAAVVVPAQISASTV